MPRSRAATIAVAAAMVLAGGCASRENVRNTTAAPAPTAGSALAANPARFVCPVADPVASGRARTEGDAAPVGGQRLAVVTTVAPITSIVANVAGDRADVRGLIPEGEDSHTFEPKPSAARVLAEADVVFVNGLELEDATRDLAATNVPEGTPIVELGPLTISPDRYRYDVSFPRDAGKPNPHLWTNPPMARCYVSIVARTLAAADPGQAAYFNDNAVRLQARIDDLDRRMAAASALLPAASRTLLTYHDAYAYVADHYGWKVIGAIQVSSFEDPTPKEVAALIEQIEDEQVPAIFGSEVFPSPVLEQIAAETGVRYVDTLRDDDLPGGPGDRDHSYLGLMTYDFVTLVTTMGGDAAALQGFDPTDVAPDRADYPQ